LECAGAHAMSLRPGHEKFKVRGSKFKVLGCSLHEA
jgi:hypothetical protein